MVKVHSPDHTMLFRHFMEGVVRTAMARYPYIPTMDAQLEKLFKVNILPNLHTPPTTALSFKIIRSKKFLQMRQKYDPVLFQIFCSLGALGRCRECECWLPISHPNGLWVLLLFQACMERSGRRL